MESIIREYRAEDLNDLLSAWESASRLAHPFLTDEFLEQERDNIPNLYLPNAETWVIEQGGQVIGFIALLGNEVGAIFVQPEFHGTGAGKALMDKAQELRGDLEVEVFKENTIGQEFYARYGFQPLKESVHEPTGNQIIRLKFTASESN
ncbi:GNAT family N-acetyltransferase [Gimesia aquarii]|uniref:Putative N-acetyltransferase YjaB n=1 Tax=Gimesia aquarii TaxID=2527964 RepID=A0A517WR21_9PLAN|nr:GNAT family N-acetyltransferase [Gimesia aquarii]QDU07704.1 putative N-acetyltransferase YjaB [Gimesia aquarii]